MAARVAKAARFLHENGTPLIESPILVLESRNKDWRKACELRLLPMCSVSGYLPNCALHEAKRARKCPRGNRPQGEGSGPRRPILCRDPEEGWGQGVQKTPRRYLAPSPRRPPPKSTLSLQAQVDGSGGPWATVSWQGTSYGTNRRAACLLATWGGGRPACRPRVHAQGARWQGGCLVHVGGCKLAGHAEWHQLTCNPDPWDRGSLLVTQGARRPAGLQSLRGGEKLQGTGCKWAGHAVWHKMPCDLTPRDKGSRAARGKARITQA